MFSRRQPCCASSGICSMNRSSYPRSRQYSSSAGASSSLSPRISTELTLTGRSPAACAEARPASTSSSRSRRDSWRKVCGFSVSSETLIRSRPPARSGSASRVSPIPFVVSEISGRGRSSAARAMMAGRPRRSSGSPPVNRISVMPRCRHPDPGQPDHLIVGQQRGVGQPLQAFRRHAVRAPQVAPVGEGYPQVGCYTPVRVGESMGVGGNGISPPFICGAKRPHGHPAYVASHVSIDRLTQPGQPGDARPGALSDHDSNIAVRPGPRAPRGAPA